MRTCILLIINLSLLLLLPGCTKKTVADYSSLLTIDVPVRQTDNPHLFDSLFKYRRHISLETNDSCLIGKIGKLKIVGDKIYLLDSKENKILVFGPDGSYIRQYDHAGEGNGEYLYLSDFDIRKDRIYLLDKTRGKVFVYNLAHDEFIASYAVPRSQGIAVLDTARFALNLGLGQAVKGSKMYSYAVSESQDCVKWDKAFNKALVGRTYSYSEGSHYFSSRGDSVFAFFPFNDTVFTVCPNGVLSPYLVAKRGEESIGSDDSPQQVKRKLEKYSSSIFSFYKWNRHVLFSFYYADNPRKYLLSDSEGNILFCGYFGLDRNKIPVRVIPYETDCREFDLLSLVYPFELMGLIDTNRQPTPLLRKLAEGKDTESNPILVFYQFALE